jgi:di/tricarboxylate transporter
MSETLTQWVSWAVLAGVLLFVASGKTAIDRVAWAGLMILALLRVAPLPVLLSGFGHPALITIVAVMIMSQGIAASGVLSGLGLKIASKTRTLQGQILATSLLSAFLSAFMNNVGAVGLVLNTATRMADRARVHRGVFGMPLAFASILGGTLTLIGSAPNIIVSSYLHSLTGSGFRMFDFVPHGLAIIFSFVLLWQVSLRLGFLPIRNMPNLQNPKPVDVPAPSQPGLLATPKRRATVGIVGTAVILVSAGAIAPAVGFGSVVLLLVAARVISSTEAYSSIELPIVVFLAAMIGIGQALESVGALAKVSEKLIPFAEQLPGPLLLVVIFFSAVLFANAINNTAAAVIMAPIAAALAGQTAGITIQAALMAVAAGANLALVLPTHQATLLVLSKAPFSIPIYIRSGIVLTIVSGLAASLMIIFVWN